MAKVMQDDRAVESRIDSTIASLQPVCGMSAGAIVRVQGLHVPILLVAHAPDIGNVWWGLPVATGDQPVLPGDYLLPVGMVPFRVHMAHPTYVGDATVVVAQLTQDVLLSVKSASLDFLLGADSGDDVAITPAVVDYRDWLIRELAAYRHRMLYA